MATHRPLNFLHDSNQQLLPFHTRTLQALLQIVVLPLNIMASGFTLPVSELRTAGTFVSKVISSECTANGVSYSVYLKINQI